MNDFLNTSASLEFSSRCVAIKIRSIVCQDRNEFLNPFVLFLLSRIDVPSRIHGDCINPVKLAGVCAVTAESADRRAASAVENPYFVVSAVCDVEVFLLQIARKCELVRCSAW